MCDGATVLELLPPHCLTGNYILKMLFNQQFRAGQEHGEQGKALPCHARHWEGKAKQGKAG
jgi:hypothetical protein